MKKLLIILFVMICCVSAASAEVVGVTPYGKYIVAYQADNGQMLYCISCVEETEILRKDVNFDGVEDYVFSINGTNLELYEFFVWDGAQYVLAMHPCTTDHTLKGPIPQYELYPELGMVCACVDLGENGAHFIKYLMRWEGTDLVLLRRVEANVYTWHGLEEGIPVSRQYEDQVQIDVRDYSQDEWGSVLYDEVLPLHKMTKEKHRQIEEAFWQGLK